MLWQTVKIVVESIEQDLLRKLTHTFFVHALLYPRLTVYRAFTTLKRATDTLLERRRWRHLFDQTTPHRGRQGTPTAEAQCHNCTMIEYSALASCPRPSIELLLDLHFVLASTSSCQSLLCARVSTQMTLACVFSATGYELPYQFAGRI